MGYTLQAILGDETVLTPVAGELVAVRVNQGKLLIPLTEQVRQSRRIPFLPFTGEGADIIPDSLATLCRSLSALGRIAYLEAEFFGGVGAQAIILAEYGVMIGGPEVHESAINVALRFLGVSRDGTTDEFDSVGLGMQRDTEHWLNPPNCG